MATEAGAALTRIDRHYIYINGIIDPRDQQQSHALTAGNDHSLWVNTGGRRFTNEAGFDKDILVDLPQPESSSYWMVFDEAARDRFVVLALAEPDVALARVVVARLFAEKHHYQRPDRKQRDRRDRGDDDVAAEDVRIHPPNPNTLET